MIFERKMYLQRLISGRGNGMVKQKSLLNVPDSFKKIIITDEYHPSHYNEDGVYIMGLFDFLLNPNSLEI